SIKGEILTLMPERAAKIRSDLLATHRANQSRDLAHHAAISHLYAKLPDTIELTRDEFEDLVTFQPAFTMFMHAWWPLLDASELLLRLADRPLLDRIAPGLSPAERDALAASYAGRTPQRPDWTIADMALLDELVAKVGPVPYDDEAEPSLFLEGGGVVEELVTTADKYTDRREVDPDAEPHDTYAHVLVDESQDVTPMQWRMVRRRGPQASWTLVGDPAQSSWPVADETEEALNALIGHAPRRTYRLSTNYRSPAEVFELAAQIIRPVYPEADLPQAVRSTGIEPLLLTAPREQMLAEIDARIADLSTQVEGTIGIICPPSLVTEVIEASGELPALAAAVERLAIVTAQQSKGLEYDAVLVVSPDDIVAETPGGVRVLYVALTRPTQRLVVIDLVDAADAVGEWRSALG
ncbi:MAG TPA: ATP-binding domain-containing protein, partial [Propionibacteriaceae bacterium]|nr:ATP-binding domain-containing protein [Propionibacteriaceae bacterium]